MNMYDEVFAQIVESSLNEIDKRIDHVCMMFARVDGKYKASIVITNDDPDICNLYVSDLCNNVYDAVVNLSGKLDE